MPKRHIAGGENNYTCFPLVRQMSEPAKPQYILTSSNSEAPAETSTEWRPGEMLNFCYSNAVANCR